jgi:hypothetical protein
MGQSRKERLLQYIRLVPLKEWYSYGGETSVKEREALITGALRLDSIEKRDKIKKGVISFEDRDYPLFILFQANDNRDLLIQVSYAARWISVTTFWQFDPMKKILRNVTNSFKQKEPSIKSFFASDFSFAGKDTLNKETDLLIQSSPHENQLQYFLTTDPMNRNNWINKARDEKLIYRWIGRWDGNKFNWKKEKE